MSNGTPCIRGARRLLVSLVLSCCGLLLVSVASAATNTLFTLMSDGLYGPATKYPKPAEMDPKGNWGLPLDDFQISIRFETNVFRVGEPIPAVVIIRNIGLINRLVFLGGWREGVLFKLTDDYYRKILTRREQDEVNTPPKPSDRWLSSSWGQPRGSSHAIPAGQQREISIDLVERYRLTRAGVYFVRVEVVPFGTSGGPNPPVSSGLAMFRLLNADGTTNVLESATPPIRTGHPTNPVTPAPPRSAGGTNTAVDTAPPTSPQGSSPAAQAPVPGLPQPDSIASVTSGEDGTAPETPTAPGRGFLWVLASAAAVCGALLVQGYLRRRLNKGRAVVDESRTRDPSDWKS